jgi:hypothetical protein
MNSMYTYLGVLMLFTPSILTTMNMVTCEKGPSKWFFDPTVNRCDAAYVLASTLASMAFVYVLLLVYNLRNASPYSMT